MISITFLHLSFGVCDVATKHNKKEHHTKIHFFLYTWLREVIWMTILNILAEAAKCLQDAQRLCQKESAGLIDARQKQSGECR